MKTVLNKIIEAHGGESRWRKLSKVQFDIVSSGKLFDMQGFPQDLSPRKMVELHKQHASMRPFGAPNQKTNFNAKRIAIETLEGEVLFERTGNASEIHQHMTNGNWDALDRAYFNGYALWTYLTSPFLLLMDGFEVTEINPLEINGEICRGITVQFPQYIASHSSTQQFYFGSDFLLKRHDYFIDVAGNFHAAQLLLNYVETDGIKLPAKRRAYKKTADNQPAKEDLMVAIDISNIKFS
ncbi:hypothetical protein DU508_20965 [Pedobacter chinensis]|uniref:Uncharacterized protein n=1 Tax=Pedobacter chinensis TaxID=2282421 RepID=A0A369PPW5_9SPHI|nr:hypothetical protein [Pedobacter chinensis]RDC54691.1 hypothetical protein DU508_20965 [Pedobacter chinensis]